MSRRQDREGVPRHGLQARRNTECNPESHCNARGWYVPHLAWEGWEEFERACYALRRYMIIRHESDLRSAYFGLEASRNCARPKLP